MKAIKAPKLRNIILEKNNKGAVFFPVFVRHHWVACVFTSEKEILFFDSAPSFIVRRDIERMFADLGFTNMFFLPCPKQKRNSNECGLFVILNLLAFRRKAKKWFGLREANLSSLRTSLGFEIFLESIEKENQTTKNKKNSGPRHHQLEKKDQTTKEKNEKTKILCGGGQKEKVSEKVALTRSKKEADQEVENIQTKEKIKNSQTNIRKDPQNNHQLETMDQKTKEKTKILCGGGQKELFCWNKYSANGAARENLCWCYCAVLFCSFVGRVVGKPFSFSVHLNDLRNLRETIFPGENRQQDCCEAVAFLTEGWPLFFMGPQDETASSPSRFIVVLNANYQQGRVTALLEYYDFLAGVNFEGNLNAMGATSGH